MSTALIGSTGFIGSNLREQASFDALYHSRNIAEITGRRFELVVCAGAPATKWQANRDPDADWATIQHLIACLGTIQARRFVLISTIDVYPAPWGVDEQTPIDEAAACAYGRHRYRLERFAHERFAATIIRLPGVFGRHLKKNIVYDLLHDHAVDRIHPHGVFQFYDVERLWGDTQRLLQAGIPLANFACEPLSSAAIARHCFQRELTLIPDQAAPRYDFRSRHCARWGRTDGYLYDRDQTLQALAGFVAAERGGRA